MESKFEMLINETLNQLDEVVTGFTGNKLQGTQSPVGLAQSGGQQQQPQQQQGQQQPQQQQGQQQPQQQPQQPQQQQQSGTNSDQDLDAVMNWALSLPPDQAKKYTSLQGQEKYDALYNDFQLSQQNTQ